MDLTAVAAIGRKLCLGPITKVAFVSNPRRKILTAQNGPEEHAENLRQSIYEIAICSNILHLITGPQMEVSCGAFTRCLLGAKRA